MAAQSGRADRSRGRKTPRNDRDLRERVGNSCYSKRRWFAFIFIGGVQPRKIKVDDQVRTCPACGLPSARLKRMDHYLSLFFIPLIPVKRGERFLECDRCGRVFDETGRSQPGPFQYKPAQSCPRCGREVEPDFKFCPCCGESLILDKTGKI